MTLRIRPAEPADADELAALLNEIIAAGGTTAHEDLFNAETFEAAYLTGPGAIFCFIAIGDGGEFLGFQALEWSADLPDGYGDIGTFTRIGHVQGGVGGALFQATRNEAQRLGLKGINATIRADNAGGLNFYSRMGFVDHSVHPGRPLKDGRLVDRINKRYRL